jgi:hypothetical protein
VAAIGQAGQGALQLAALMQVTLGEVDIETQAEVPQRVLDLAEASGQRPSRGRAAAHLRPARRLRPDDAQ